MATILSSYVKIRKSNVLLCHVMDGILCLCQLLLQNSNILSSILCLIKEIDGPSLEVVEMAVRCRMEELED